jgi:hypothetical protein
VLILRTFYWESKQRDVTNSHPLGIELASELGTLLATELGTLFASELGTLFNLDENLPKR